MRASLISREVIADSIELVCAGHLFDGLVCIVGCDKTLPGAAMGLARLKHSRPALLQRLDRPGPVPGQGRHDPGRLRGDRRARRWEDHRRGRVRARVVRVPRPRCVRRPVHRQPMALVLDFLGISPRGLSGIRRRIPARTRRRSRREEWRWSSSARTRSRRTSSRARRSRTRSPRSRAPAARRTACCICWRSRVRPASSSRSTTSTRSRRRRRSSPTSSRSAATSQPISRKRAASASSRASSSARAGSTPTRVASTAARSATSRPL